MKYWLFTLLVFLVSCSSGDPLSNFCKNTTSQSFDPNFRIWCPAQDDRSLVPVKYGCPPSGNAVSPPISWSGIPEGAERLRITLEGVTCVYECTANCKYDQWILDFPLDKSVPFVGAGQIEEGASTTSSLEQYTLLNTRGLKAYMPFCPPMGQTHAYVIRAIAYRMQGSTPVIVGRTQSKPLLFSLTEYTPHD